MEVIAEDIQKLEEVVANLKCNPIIKFIKDLFKCFEDSISYFFTISKKQD